MLISKSRKGASYPLSMLSFLALGYSIADFGDHAKLDSG
jgi:hypothetical protein